MCKCGSDSRGNHSVIAHPPRQLQLETYGSDTQEDMVLLSLSAKPLGPQSMFPQPVSMGLLGSIINKPVPERTSKLQLLPFSRTALFSSECSLTWGQVAQTPAILRDLEDPTNCLIQGRGKPLSATHTLRG